jgi:hypothetical protein
MGEVIGGGDDGVGKSATLPVRVDVELDIDNSGGREDADQVPNTYEGSPFVGTGAVDSVVADFRGGLDDAIARAQDVPLFDASGRRLTISPLDTESAVGSTTVVPGEEEVE